MKEAIEIFLNQFNKKCEENTYTPRVRVSSTIDEGKGLTPHERAVHIYHEIKKQ